MRTHSSPTPQNEHWALPWRRCWKQTRRVGHPMSLLLLKLKPKQRSEGQEGSTGRGLQQHHQEKSTYHPPSGSPCFSKILERMLQGETSSIIKTRDPPWPSCEPQRQRHYTCVHRRMSKLRSCSLSRDSTTMRMLQQCYSNEDTTMRSTLWMGLKERRRHMFHWLLTRMLLCSQQYWDHVSPVG